jgi:hypothetical protein
MEDLQKIGNESPQSLSTEPYELARELAALERNLLEVGQASKYLLASGAVEMLQLEELLPCYYAPELNPDEGIGKHSRCMWI